MNNKICPSCGFIGNETSQTKGSFIIELFLWIAGCFVGFMIGLWILFLILPLLYSLWRLVSRYSACPKCKVSHMIPTDSPMAKKIMGSLTAMLLMLCSSAYCGEWVYVEEQPKADQMKYNSYEKKWSYEAPESQIRYNPYQKEWSYVREDEQLKFNPYSKRWEYAR